MRSTPPSSETARPSPSAGRLPRYAVGIVNYRSYPELERALRSVAGQSFPAVETVVADLEGGGSVAARLQAEFSPVRWEVLPNVGYAAASNRCLEWLAQAHPGLEFVLLLNADIELEPDFASALLSEMSEVPEAVLGTGKLLRDDARTLDSTGIVLPRNRRPRDRGSEQRDEGQYDRVEFVWGVSGAALMIRLDCLGKLAIEGEVFDEDFFMYHEDTDLAWRAQNFGMRSLYVPAARAIHQRGWKSSSRFERPVTLRRHSFKNHYLEIAKNESLAGFVVNLPYFVCWEVARFGYALLRDRAVLPAYRDAWRLWAPTWRKRKLLRQRMREPVDDASP